MSEQALPDRGTTTSNEKLHLCEQGLNLFLFQHTVYVRTYSDFAEYSFPNAFESEIPFWTVLVAIFVAAAVAAVLVAAVGGIAGATCQVSSLSENFKLVTCTPSCALYLQYS